MRAISWFGPCLVLLVAGCVALPPEEIAPPKTAKLLDEEWRGTHAFGSAWYEDGVLHVDAIGDSIVLGFSAAEPVRFDPFRIVLKANFSEERRSNEALYAFTLWDQAAATHFTYYWAYNHDEYVYSGSELIGGEIAAIRDFQYLLGDDPTTGIGLQSEGSVDLPAGEWAILIGGAPFGSIRLSIDFPPRTVTVPTIKAQKACSIVPPSAFEATLAAWSIAGPVAIWEARYAFDVAHGIHGFFGINGAGGATYSEVRIERPDTTAPTHQGLDTETGALMLFEPMNPGAYAAVIEYGAGLAFNSFTSAHCALPALE